MDALAERFHRNSLEVYAIQSMHARQKNTSTFRVDDVFRVVPSFFLGRQLAFSSSSHSGPGLAAASCSSADCTRVSSPSLSPWPAALKTTNHPYSDC